MSGTPCEAGESSGSSSPIELVRISTPAAAMTVGQPPLADEADDPLSSVYPAPARGQPPLSAGSTPARQHVPPPKVYAPPREGRRASRLKSEPGPPMTLGGAATAGIRIII